MPFEKHAKEIDGLKVAIFTPKTKELDLAKAYKLQCPTYDEEDEGPSIKECLDALVEMKDVSKLRGLVIGRWDGIGDGGDSKKLEKQLMKHEKLFKNLTAFFFGDLTYEDCNVSDVFVDNFKQFIEAFPKLEYARVRAQSPKIGPAKHSKLRTFIVETGAIETKMLDQIAKSAFPALEKLEVWIGHDRHGDGSDDPGGDEVEPLLTGKLFPKLTHLGLRDAWRADSIAAAVATSPILSRLKVLDLSMGTLGNEGAESLLASDSLDKLEELIIDHHWVAPDLVKKLKKRVKKVSAKDAQDPEEDAEERYVAVAE